MLIFIPVVLWAVAVNWSTRQKEEGAERRELAEFIMSTEDDKTAFYMPERTAGDLWKLQCFASALKYMGSDALFITDMELSATRKRFLSNGNYCKVSHRLPQEGDYVIVRKDVGEPGNVKDLPSVYENRVYKIYYIESANDNQIVSEN